MLKDNQWRSISTFRVIPNGGLIRATTHHDMIEFMEATLVIMSDPRKTVLLNRFTPFDYIIKNTIPTNTLVGK